jgi:hypothetical protein
LVDTRNLPPITLAINDLGEVRTRVENAAH